MGRTAHLNFSDVAAGLSRTTVGGEIIRFAPVHNPLPFAS